MERDNGLNASAGINPDVEEDGEAHLRQMLAADDEFRWAWEEGRSKRELGMFVLEKRLDFANAARRTVEAAISAGGMSRAERRAAKKRLKGIGKGKAK